MKELETLLKDLYLISGLNLSIFDIDENLVVSYPRKKSPFCQLINQCKEAKQYCKLYDHNAFLKVKETGVIYIYQCHFNLYEAVVPLYTYGQHSGYLMMGQTLTNSLFDLNDIKNKAEQYIKDDEQLDVAIQQISTHTKEQILAFANIVDVCAKYITLTNRVENKTKDLAQEIEKYIKLNYKHPISIDALCDLFFCSKSTLINHFKKEHKITIHQFLLNYRLEKAIELLHNDNLTIEEVALSSGFSDGNYFSKAFKKKYGLSPNEYKKSSFISITGA